MRQILNYTLCATDPTIGALINETDMTLRSEVGKETSFLLGK